MAKVLLAMPAAMAVYLVHTLFWNYSEGTFMKRRLTNAQPSITIAGRGLPNSGFPTLWTLQVGGLVIGDISDYGGDESRMYPGIRFTCEGNVTAWIAVTTGANSGNATQLQIWDETDDGLMYNLSSSTSLQAADGSLVHVPSQPIPFKNGSILGLHQPCDSFFSVLHVTGGSGSVRTAYPGAKTVNTSAENPLLRDYPLVGVKTSKLPAADTGFRGEGTDGGCGWGWGRLLARYEKRGGGGGGGGGGCCRFMARYEERGGGGECARFLAQNEERGGRGGGGCCRFLARYEGRGGGGGV